ncbi:hypothetical protein K8Q96_02165 [Candidatus Nomurabacteria bacterium]|nr:hypothetical protein [Candidatus Nomurabacteria bacterium]
MEIKLEEKTLDALKWIVSILNKNNIPYRIGGGFAAHVYGSSRPVNDIDFSLSGEYFPIIVAETKDYITSGPKHYLNEKWDCDTISLNYNGQEIDITDIDTLRMSNKEQTEWFQTKDNFRKFPNKIVSIAGIEVSLINPRDLIAYKKELADKDHQYQMLDVQAIEKYIENN